MINSLFSWLQSHSQPRWPFVTAGMVTCFTAIGFVANGLAQVDSPRPTKPHAQTFDSTQAASETAVWGFGQDAAIATSPSFPAAAAVTVTRASRPSTLLAAELRLQSDDQRDPAQVERLRELLKKEFDARHRQQVERLEQLLAQAARTQEVLKLREEEKGKIIDRRLTEMLGGRDPMQWNYQPGAPFPAGARQAGLRPDRPTALWNPASPKHQAENGWPPGTPYTAPPSPGLPPTAPLAPNAKETRLPGLALRERQRVAEIEQTQQNIRKQQQSLAKTIGGNSIDLSPQDVIATGYRIETLMADAAETRSLFESGLIQRSELRKLESDLKTAEAQWDFAKRELQNKIEIAKVETNALVQQLESSLRLMESEQPEARERANRERLEAEKQMRIAELQLRQLKERLNWMSQFEANISQAEESSEISKAETSNRTSGKAQADGYQKNTEASSSNPATANPARGIDPDDK